MERAIFSVALAQLGKNRKVKPISETNLHIGSGLADPGLLSLDPLKTRARPISQQPHKQLNSPKAESPLPFIIANQRSFLE
jgi:hypothetical protein